MGLGLWSRRMWVRSREADEGELCHRGVTGTGDFHQKPALGANPPPLLVLLRFGRASKDLEQLGECSRPWIPPSPEGFSLLGAAQRERSWLSPALRGVPAASEPGGMHSSAQGPRPWVRVLKAPGAAPFLREVSCKKSFFCV